MIPVDSAYSDAQAPFWKARPSELVSELGISLFPPSFLTRNPTFISVLDPELQVPANSESELHFWGSEPSSCHLRLGLSSQTHLEVRSFPSLYPRG